MGEWVRPENQGHEAIAKAMLKALYDTVRFIADEELESTEAAEFFGLPPAALKALAMKIWIANQESLPTEDQTIAANERLYDLVEAFKEQIQKALSTGDPNAYGQVFVTAFTFAALVTSRAKEILEDPNDLDGL